MGLGSKSLSQYGFGVVAEELRHCTQSWIGSGHPRTSPGLVFSQWAPRRIIELRKPTSHNPCGSIISQYRKAVPEEHESKVFSGGVATPMLVTKCACLRSVQDLSMTGKHYGHDAAMHVVIFIKNNVAITVSTSISIIIIIIVIIIIFITVVVVVVLIYMLQLLASIMTRTPTSSCWQYYLPKDAHAYETRRTRQKPELQWHRMLYKALRRLAPPGTGLGCLRLRGYLGLDSQRLRTAQ